MSDMIGKEARIKAGWMKGEWGIIYGVIGDEYHVGIYGDRDNCQVFSREEITIKSRGGRREGAGRKPSGKPPKTTWSVKVTPEEKRILIDTLNRIREKAED